MTKRPAVFRFAPPPARRSPTLLWVLGRALGPSEVGVPLPIAEIPRALDLADRLGLAERIATRVVREPALREVGEEGWERLRTLRARTAVQELRLDEALAEVIEAAGSLGMAVVLLKGRALAQAGYSAMGSRWAVDLDLLVAENRIDELQGELLSRGFRDSGGPGYEHQKPLLTHSAGGAVELHRMIPGVRVEGARSATFEDLVRAQEVEPSAREAANAFVVLFVPSREVLTAHALAHAIAQHGFAAGGPGFRVVGDLIDLGWGGEGPVSGLDRIASWLHEDVSRRELDAAIGLARVCAEGRDPFSGPEDVAALASHFVACALDAEYGELLRTRSLERPLTDRSRLRARLEVLKGALVPRRARAAGGAQEPLRGYLARLARRPSELARRWARARRFARRLSSDGGEPATKPGFDPGRE